MLETSEDPVEVYSGYVPGISIGYGISRHGLRMQIGVIGFVFAYMHGWKLKTRKRCHTVKICTEVSPMAIIIFDCCSVLSNQSTEDHTRGLDISCIYHLRQGPYPILATIPTPAMTNQNLRRLCVFPHFVSLALPKDSLMIISKV